MYGIWNKQPREDEEIKTNEPVSRPVNGGITQDKFYLSLIKQRECLIKGISKGLKLKTELNKVDKMLGKYHINELKEISFIRK